MRLKDKKKICAALVGVCLLGGGMGFATLDRQHPVQAYTVEMQTAEIAKQYYIDDELVLPSSVSVDYQDQTYTMTNGVVYYPDGKAYQKERYELNQVGEYKVVYTVSVDEDVLYAEQTFSVIEKNWTVSKSQSTVEYGALSIKSEEYAEGLKVSLVDGDVFTYHVPVDLHKDDVTDILTIHSTQTTATARVSNIIVRATDCYDAEKYVDFYLYYAPGGSIYARAGASNQADTGLYKSETLEESAIRKVVYIDGVRYVAYYSNWGVSMATGVSSTSDSGFTWIYDNQSKEVRVLQSRSPEGGDKVTQLANADIYGKDIFEGFTTGEVYLSVFAEGYSEATADFEIACIDGKFGAELNAADYKDEKAPVLKVDYTPTIGNSVYVAQGETVNLFDATAIDVSGASVKTAVYYNYDSTKRTAVYVEDGTFVASKPGAYTIVYTAKDPCGNETVEKVVINSVSTENGKAINFHVEELSEMYAGKEVVIPAYEAHGLNGEVTVQTTLIYPNGKTEELTGNAFVPLYVGMYTIEYRYSDAVNQYSYSYKLESKASDAVRFLTEVELPRYFIKGAKYGLDDIKAYLFQEENPTPVEAEFYVKYDGGEYVAADSQEFTVSGSESVQVKFVYGDTVLESEISPIVDVGYTSKISVSQYFQGAFSAEEKGSYVNYLSNVSSGNNTMQFINALSFDNFNLEFTVPLGAYYKSLKLTLTDYYNADVKTSVEFLTVDGSLAVKIDGVLYKCNDSFANGKLKRIWYNNDVHKFVLPDAQTVSHESKFASDYFFLDVELVDIMAESSIQIHTVNNQSLGKLVGDRIDPEIYMKKASGQRTINDEVVLAPASYCDVLSPALQKNLTVSVKAPDGEYVTAKDGTLLDGSAFGGKEYSFDVTQYGNYRVVYRAIDQKGNDVERPCVIIVEDEVAPQIELTCAKEVTVPYLTVYKIEEFSVSDNISADEDLTVMVVVVDEKNNSVISVGEEFEARYIGKYKVYVYCADKAGNTSYASYTIIVTDEK